MPLTDRSEREQALSNFLTRVAKLYVRQTVSDMVQGPHTGVLYRRARGPNFRRSHQASAKDEHPAPDTLNLINSVKDRKLSPSSHEAYVDDEQAPYGKYLERPRLSRRIMHPADVRKFVASTVQIEVRRVQDRLTRRD